MDNIDQLKKLAQIFNTDKIISKEEIDGILAAIVQILANNKRSVDETVASTQRELENTLDTIITKHNEIIQSVGETTRTTKDELTTKLEAELAKALARVDDLVAEARSVMPENGKDADEELIVTEVLKQIKLPEYKEVMLDSGEDIVQKINLLPENGEFKIDAVHIKNLPQAAQRVYGGTRMLSKLVDVNVTDIQDNDVLQWNAATGRFENAQVSGGSGNGITSINADTTAAQILTVGTSGTDFAISDNGTGAHTFNLPTASATNRGALSSADWTTFNNKQGAITPAALTKTDDTNVTLTLGGSPSTSLLAATSLTLGWTGQLGVSRGGTGVSAISALSIWVANSANTITEVTPSAGQSIRLNAGGTAWEAFTPSSGGTPGGSTTQLQYNNAGAFAGITGATTNGTVVTLTSPVIATSQTNSYATASTIGIFDGSKNLISADTATYPSLTELSYVKGVTSAIQTQLNAKGTGSVTSVAQSFTGGLISVSGSPVTTSGTLALTVAGTSGGIPYFSSASTWATSAALTANALVIGGGAGAAPATTTTGTGVLTALGINVGSAGAFVTFNGALGTPSSGTLTNCTGLPVAGLTASTSTAIGVGSVELGHASDTTLSRSAAGVLAVEGVVIPSISSTNTLTNKRITKRVGTTTSSATPTINTDNVDMYTLTAQTVDITSFTTNLSGTPTDGQTLWIAITGTGARAITWGSSFEASTVALPTTTVSTNRLDVGFVWNAATSKWRCIASA